MSTQLELGGRAAIADRVREHLVDALDATSVEHDPFAHFYVERVFPEEVYDALLAHLPAEALYNADNPKKYKQGPGQSLRYTLGLDEVTFGRLTEASCELWGGVADALTSDAVRRKVFDMLAPDLCRRFGTDRAGLEGIPVYARPGLVRDLSGYWIEPHPDTAAKVVTTQFYLADPHTSTDLGTTLYRRRLLKWRNLVSPTSCFEPVRRFQFRPNTGYGFAVGRRSWHGREKLPDGSGVRNSLMNIYYRDPERGW